jgi:hypothetical protein
MKKLASFIVIYSLCFIVKAQVTTLPHSIGIGQNTLSSIPFHINKNGEIVRFQGTNPYVSFYNSVNWLGYLQAFNSTLILGTKNSSDLGFYVNDVEAAKISGVNSQLTTNNKLNANGGLKITGALEAASGSAGTDGMVLVSKGSSTTPAWEEVEVGFSSYLTANLSMTTGTTYFLSTLTEIFDEGSDFNHTTGEFTAPSAGVYHFDVNATFSSAAAAANAYVFISIFKNNIFLYQSNSDVNISTSLATGTNAVFTVKLAQNDVIKFRISQNSGATQILFGNSGYLLISGFKAF